MEPVVEFASVWSVLASDGPTINEEGCGWFASCNTWGSYGKALSKDSNIVLS